MAELRTDCGDIKESARDGYVPSVVPKKDNAVQLIMVSEQDILQDCGALTNNPSAIVEMMIVVEFPSVSRGVLCCSNIYAIAPPGYSLRLIHAFSLNWIEHAKLMVPITKRVALNASWPMKGLVPWRLLNFRV